METHPIAKTDSLYMPKTVHGSSRQGRTGDEIQRAGSSSQGQRVREFGKAKPTGACTLTQHMEG